MANAIATVIRVRIDIPDPPSFRVQENLLSGEDQAPFWEMGGLHRL